MINTGLRTRKVRLLPGGGEKRLLVPRLLKLLFLSLGLLIFPLPQAGAASAFQFDVFIGYDGTIHEAAWFPVTFEVFNDGAPFTATLQVTSGQFGAGQTRQVKVELPTNTRKRVVIPMFASGGRFAQSAEWEAKLIDENGKVRETRQKVQVKQADRDALLLGALPRNFGGMPTLPNVTDAMRDFKPEVCRIQLEQFPDNPVALEGLNAFYLNSEKALELKLPQITALLAWVRNGGHLILGVENLSDVTATPWLSQFLPVDLSSQVNLKLQNEVQGWLKGEQSELELEAMGGIRSRMASRNDQSFFEGIPRDPNFKDIEMVVATGTMKEGARVAMSHPGAPLAIQGYRGRGTVTVLTFSPEREPFRSWKSRNYFWAKLCGVPGDIFSSDEYSQSYGGTSIDGVFGALIDSRQIKKLPVEWLLAILVIYLLVIGPFDQWWLKKINRQMLTWITFPTYVVLFSVLIYFIGYKLRAGETEWNELNIVDVLPRGEKADLRGRSYISIYSSGNATYELAGEEGYATLRNELLDIASGSRETGRNTIVQDGNGYKAELPVPVWTSLLYANDWFTTNNLPFTATVQPQGNDWVAEVRNLLDVPLTQVRIAVGNFIFDTKEDIAPGSIKKFTLNQTSGTLIPSFVSQNAGHYSRAVEMRRNPVGDMMPIEDRALTGTVVSLIHAPEAGRTDRRKTYVTPPGLDLTHLVERGDAIIFAFIADRGLAAPNNKFTPPRLKRDTLLRLSLPVKKA